jgi:transcriptional regulator with XRE-family HTH domain
MITMVTSEQLKAARALLKWRQVDLAEASGLALITIKRLESISGPLYARQGTIDALQHALERAGIKISNRGVSL